MSSIPNQKLEILLQQTNTNFPPLVSLAAGLNVAEHGQANEAVLAPSIEPHKIARMCNSCFP